MAKPKIKHTITKKKWNKTHRDFKTTIDGTPYIMMYNDKVGTHLVPVKIVNETITEVERGDMGYVEKHKSIATVYGVMSGGKKVKVKLGKTGKVVVIDTKDIRILPESLEEMDMNDPILVKLRAAQMRKNKEAAKKIDNDIIKLGGNPMSESVNEVNYTNQTGIKSSVLKNNKVSSLIDFKLWRWAIDKSVKLYKGIGQNYMFTDGIMSLGINLNKPYTIVKKWGKVDNKLKQIHLKNINENDGVYFKSYTAAIEVARAAALKKGFEVEDDEMFTKVGMNSKRPSVGKTTKVSLELIKNGKPQRKMLHIQVYGMKNGYELNSYIN